MRLPCKAINAISHPFWRTLITDTTTKVQEHYSDAGLTGRIKSALASFAAIGRPLMTIEDFINENRSLLKQPALNGLK